MKFEQSFVIEAPRDVVWKYFEEEATVVGMCIPGAESVEPLGNDKYRVIVTQKLGSIGATFDLNEANLRRWLRDPPAMKPMDPDNGMGMPNLGLSDAEITQLIAYLETLK